MVWRTGIILTCIIGAAVLAYQIGSRLSDEAVMTIAGVSCGILAGIPVSLGLLLALTRERAVYPQNDAVDPEPELAPVPYNVYRAPAPQPQLPPQQPQIILVAPPQSQFPQHLLAYQNYPPQSVPLLPAPAPMQERTFKIVGEEDGD